MQLLTKKRVLAISVGIVAIAIASHFYLQWLWSVTGAVDSPLHQYDIIIVGGGSAGCVLARRLVEGSNLSVLLIEAGGGPPFLSRVPFLAPALQKNRAWDWAYETLPQTDAMGALHDRKSAWPRGRVLGGSSILHYMLHVWGSQSSDLHSTGLEPRHYTKAETFVTSEGLTPSWRGNSGPMKVSEFNVTSSPVAEAFLAGAESMGYTRGDLNGEIEFGAMPAQSNIWDGSRFSAFDGYLKPISDNPNIHILLGTVVVKVVISGGRAVGVVAVQESKVLRVAAQQEVVVCAGAIGTPQLLMLSGIGPAQHLQDHRIPVLVDAPWVGSNLQDHLNVPLYFHVDSPVTITTTKVRSVKQVWKYLAQGKGFMSESGVEAVARIPVPGKQKSSSQIFFMLFNLGSINEGLFTSLANFRPESFRETFPDGKNDSKEGFILFASCTRPLSRGTVRLASDDPRLHPHIQPRYLTRKEDVHCLTKAMQMGARLGSSKPLQALGVRLHLPGYPECSRHQQNLQDRYYLECWMRNAAITAYHPAGTCAVGHALDPHFRVLGVSGLRVVDASAMPHLPLGNPHATILALAEKASEFILETHGNSKENPDGEPG